MLNAVIISDMSIIIFIIKHTHPSGRNVMLDLCLTVLMGGARAGTAWSCGYFSAAAGRPPHYYCIINAGLNSPFAIWVNLRMLLSTRFFGGFTIPWGP